MGKAAQQLARKRKTARAVYARDKRAGVCVQTGCTRAVKGRAHVYCAVCLTAKNLWTKVAKRKAKAAKRKARAAKRAKGKVAA